MKDIVRPTFAVPTKTLGEPSLDWLEARGVNIPKDLELFERMCFVDMPGQGFDLLRARPKEVPDRVDCGDSVMGITCTDGLVESGRELSIIKELGFGVCKMSLMVLEASGIEDVSQLDGSKIATSYPVATQQFFDSMDIELSEILQVGGAVEGMLKAPMSQPDAIVDLVETGGSIRANGLLIIAELGKQQAILVENPELAPEYADLFELVRQ